MSESITSGGHVLDLSAERFGWLRESNDLVGDWPALAERMHHDGYLYLPGYLNRNDVIAARLSICQRLTEEGCLARGEPIEKAIAARGLQMSFRPDLAAGAPSLQHLLYGERMIGFYQGLLGGEVRHYDYTWLRVVAPGAGTPPHMDIVYMGRGTTNLFTAWVPLGDVSLQVGGLIVLEGSHR